MCNDYGNRVPYHAYIEEFSQIRLPLLTPDPIPNLEPRDEIWPTESVPVIRAADGGAELVQLPWGLAPANPKTRAVINLRAEGRGFARGRCLVPASHYFEFTGSKTPKTRWRFTRKGQDWFCFAGLLGRGVSGEAIALLTAQAGPDVAPYHDRQPVILERDIWAAWLNGAAAATDVLAPSPAGSLQVRESPRTASRVSL